MVKLDEEEDQAHQVKWVQLEVTVFPVGRTQVKTGPPDSQVPLACLVNVALKVRKARPERLEIKLSVAMDLLAIVETLGCLVRWAPKVTQVKLDFTDSVANRADVVLLARRVCQVPLGTQV